MVLPKIWQNLLEGTGNLHQATFFQLAGKLLYKLYHAKSGEIRV
jgi:hypothetical protein